MAGQQRLKIEQQGLIGRVVKVEQKQASLAQEGQLASAALAQLKLTQKAAQRQLEAGQAKLQQEVKGLGQDVEQVKGTLKKGPTAAWQRTQEQVQHESGSLVTIATAVPDASGTVTKMSASMTCVYICNACNALTVKAGAQKPWP